MKLYNALIKQESRLYLCSKSLYLFSMYYFSKYFTHQSAGFHKEKCNLIDKLGEDYKYLVDCEFRGSAKTSFAKIEFIRRICFKKSKVMIYWSLDKKIAENSLLDIALELQTNQFIIRDFWQLFFDDWNIKRSKKQGISNFLTSNWIRVQAVTTWQPIRWLIFWENRISFWVYDDFENNKTKKSFALTREVINHFNELLPALDVDWSLLFCCNKISETWSVAWLYDKFENNPEWKIFEKAVMENNKITWKDKYVKTDKEMFKINKTRKNKNKAFSLESLKRTMNKNWQSIYEQEMLNIPLVIWERFFDLKRINDRLDELIHKKYKSVWNWLYFKKYNEVCEYKIGCDVSEWYWLDSSVIEIINIDTWEQVAEFESNLVEPSELADNLIMASELYWDCSITPERNSIWTAVIEAIKLKWKTHLLTSQSLLNKKKWWVEKIRYGWLTNNLSKSKMLFDLLKDFNEWSLIIYSKPLLREMKVFTNSDLRIASFDEDITNHFDRIMAMAITNQAKYQNFYWIIKKRVNIETEQIAKSSWVPRYNKRTWVWKL